MLANKRLYYLFAAAMLAMGLLIFSLSLLMAFARSDDDRLNKSSVIYFDRPMLPDHLFYPLLMVGDQLELAFANQENKLFLQMDYAIRRLEAAHSLLALGKTHLAFITLGKAHQYLLQVNEQLLTHAVFAKHQHLGKNLSNFFLADYEGLRPQLTDSQQANLENMRQELLCYLNKFP